MSGKSHIHFQAFTATRVSASLFYSLFSIVVFSPFNLFRSADFFLPLHSNVFTPLSTEQFFPSQHFPICLFCLCLSLSLLPSVLLSSRLSSHQACKVNQPWVTTHDPVGHSHITPCTGQSTLLRVCLKQSDGEQRKIKRIWRNKNDNLRWDRLGCQEKCKVKKTSVSLLLPEKTRWDVEQKESGDVRNSTWWLESRSI